MNANVQLEKWKVAQKRHRLSDKHIEMTRQLGLIPTNWVKLTTTSWKHGNLPYLNSLKKSTLNVLKKT